MSSWRCAAGSWHSASFMESVYNLILMDDGIAIHHGKRVHVYNTVGLMNQLEREKQLGRADNLAKQLAQIDAVILDELGCRPFLDAGVALLFT